MATLVKWATTNENVSDPDLGIATQVVRATTSENHEMRVRARANNSFQWFWANTAITTGISWFNSYRQIIL